MGGGGGGVALAPPPPPPIFGLPTQTLLQCLAKSVISTNDGHISFVPSYTYVITLSCVKTGQPHACILIRIHTSLYQAHAEN